MNSELAVMLFGRLYIKMWLRRCRRIDAHPPGSLPGRCMQGCCPVTR